jgi:hypothetical protein
MRAHARLSGINCLKGTTYPKTLLKFQSVPRSKHTVSVIKSSLLMLYKELIAVCSEIHKKHINIQCGQNVELLNVKLAVHIVNIGL